MVDPALVFDVEVADRQSQGCGHHADPNCLCDVKVELTAALDWTRGPAELLGVETGEQLVQRWADYVFDNEIEGPIKPIITKRVINEAALFPERDDGEMIRKRANWPSLVALDTEAVNAIVARLKAGSPAAIVARDWGLSERQLQELNQALGGAPSRNGKNPPPWLLYAINRYREGAKVSDICAEIAKEWNVEPPSVRTIRSLVGHRGVTRAA